MIALLYFKLSCHSCWAEAQDCRTAVMEDNCRSSWGGGSQQGIPLLSMVTVWHLRSYITGRFAEDAAGPFHKAFQKASLLRVVSMCHVYFSNAHHVAPSGKEKEWYWHSTNRAAVLHATERIGLKGWIFWCSTLKKNRENERNQNSLWLCHSLPKFPWTWRSLKFSSAPSLGKKPHHF